MSTTIMRYSNTFNTRMTTTYNDGDDVHFETKDAKLIDQLQGSDSTLMMH